VSLVFINYPLETFTPTSSGALATTIHECCRVAAREGIRPTVLSRRSQEASFDWDNLHLIDYADPPTGGLKLLHARAERKLLQHRHFGYRLFLGRVVQTLKKQDLASRPLVLMNDPETAVHLRRHFPNAFILHWFFNQMDARPRYRDRFAAAVNVQAACSDFTSRYVAEYYGLHAQRQPVHTLYIAADNQAYHPAERPPEGLPILNFVGRTGPEKAPDLFLRAGLRLAKRTKAFRMQLLGSNHWGRLEMNDYQRMLSALAEELEGTGIEVRRPGHISRPDLPAELRKAHIHVTTSRWDEPFGLVTVEGMATGLAAIGSRTGGTPEIIGEDGLLFERDSEEELEDHMFRFVTDEALRIEYGKRARARVLQFNWERTWGDLKRLTGI
jgi:glycosyltransferase involved in cell wall biosynthesis